MTVKFTPPKHYMQPLKYEVGVRYVPDSFRQIITDDLRVRNGRDFMLEMFKLDQTKMTNVRDKGEAVAVYEPLDTWPVRHIFHSSSDSMEYVTALLQEYIDQAYPEKTNGERIAFFQQLTGQTQAELVGDAPDGLWYQFAPIPGDDGFTKFALFYMANDEDTVNYR